MVTKSQFQRVESNITVVPLDRPKSLEFKGMRGYGTSTPESWSIEENK